VARWRQRHQHNESRLRSDYGLAAARWHGQSPVDLGICVSRSPSRSQHVHSLFCLHALLSHVLVSRVILRMFFPNPALNNPCLTGTRLPSCLVACLRLDGEGTMAAASFCCPIQSQTNPLPPHSTLSPSIFLLVQYEYATRHRPRDRV
jgi:hypothetical protein